MISPSTAPLPLVGERVAFTGTLASMTHRQAAETVSRLGGESAGHVSKQTTLLVVGEEGWPLEANGQPSQKFQQAQALRREGLPLRILRESDFLVLADLEEKSGPVHRVYTPAMLEQKLAVPVALIRRWERTGLLRAVRRIGRLPFFDFQEVTRLQRLSALLESGVRREELEASLKALSDIFPEVGPKTPRWELLARGNHLVAKDDRGLFEPLSGQRLLSFHDLGVGDNLDRSSSEPVALPISAGVKDSDRVAVTGGAAELYLRGCQHLEEDRPAAAVEMFRAAARLRAGDLEINFCLAESLYRLGNITGALERYYVVLESAPEDLEAWTQVGCLHRELQEHAAAAAALRTALQIHPDYPEAHFHLAETLHEMNDPNARNHWQQYLQFDRRGPWADLSRQRLGELD